MSLHTRKTRRTLATARAPPPWSGFARNVAAGEKRSALTTHSTSLLASSQSRSAQIVFLNQPCGRIQQIPLFLRLRAFTVHVLELVKLFNGARVCLMGTHS